MRPINGVNLPAVKDYAGKAANHLRVHTHEYYNAVNEAMQNLVTKEEMTQALGIIKDRLLNGKFP